MVNQKERKQSYLVDIKLLPLLLMYPDPGSNRDGLLHWCLRPARLPIPPSGLAFAGANIRRVLDSTKGLRDFFWLWLILFSDITFESCLSETRPFFSINRGSGP